MSTGAMLGDKVVVTADSLVWSGSYLLSIGPTRLGARFYARAGRMGLTTGQGRDNVSYEYLVSGDTLWLEFQNLADRPVDGIVDRMLATTYALLPLRP